jgi:hypothetical protein
MELSLNPAGLTSIFFVAAGKQRESTMKRKNISTGRTAGMYPRVYWFLVFVVLALAGTVSAQTTAFTYQGRLTDNNANASGTFEMRFKLFDALAVGTQQPQPTPITLDFTVAGSNPVTVTNGIFTVQLDFGAASFPAADRFLDISVRHNSTEAFTLLNPRQKLTSSPYAIRSTSAASADTAVNVSGVVQIANGGTGSTTQNFVDLATAQTVNGNKTFSAASVFNSNVGIGTANPERNLHVFAGSAGTVTADVSAPLVVEGSSNTFINILSPNNAEKGILFGGPISQFDGSIRYNNSGTPNGFQFRTSVNTTRAVITSAGNFGIGTTSPQRTLSVVGGLVVDQGNQNTTTNNFGIAFGSGSLEGIASNRNAGANLAGLDFYAGSGTPRMSLTNGGNFGIGTTTPSYPFHVFGSAGVGGGQSTAEFGSNTNDTGIRINNTATNGRPWALFSSGGTTGLCQGCFTVYDAAAGQPRLSVNTSGNVGIGTTNPNNVKLEVIGNSGGTGVRGIASSGIGVDGESVSFWGVWGYSGSGVGVRAQSESGVGLVVSSETGNIVDGYGNVGRTFHIDNNGTYTAGSDFAEALPASGNRTDYEPGDVLVVSIKPTGKVEKTGRPYDTRVVGIYSTRPGMLGADKNGTSRVDADDVPVAIVGIVPTKVTAVNGRVRVGDLLTTSSTPGYAMRCADRVKCVGSVVGKAMEPLVGDKGVIRVLVMLR